MGFFSYADTSGAATICEGPLRGVDDFVMTVPYRSVGRGEYVERDVLRAQMVRAISWLPLSSEESVFVNQIPWGLRVTFTSKGIRTYYETNESSLRRIGRQSAAAAGAGGDVYTINVPGVTDILRIPGLESEALRKERAQRMKQSRSGLPDFLKWIPPVLNKLDDAQDLLFTGLALAWPLLRFLPRAFLGPLGILLTVNDLLNVFT